MRTDDEGGSALRDLLTEEEARQRAAAIQGVAYELALELGGPDDTYAGSATVRFCSNRPGEPTWLDFTGLEVHSLVLNGSTVDPAGPHPHRLALPGALVREQNTVEVSWRNRHDRHGAGFHRFDDPEDGAVYLYTDFEPYCAHRLFPCFDQPDLKATWDLAVTAPAAWKVIANGAETGRTDAGDGRTRRTFARLEPFSTYLFAVIAGPYEEVRDVRDGRDLGLFVRRALRPFLDPEEIFEITRQGFGFYEEEFGVPYPFGKYDQVFVPEFNSGAMENVAAVTFHEANVFRDPPTETQRLRRAEVILHELAHMWFGNLVTMRWWDGLWLNESFATFISFLAMSEATRFKSCWQNFLGAIKAWAMRQDEKPTTHPIAGSVGDTDQTFLNFDGITYGKGAATLKQLRAFVGEEAFREGLRAYFKRHAWGNTTLEDFLQPLSEASGRDLAAWSRSWLETSGLNVITPVLGVEGGRVASLVIEQEAGNGDAVLRPHRLQVGAFARDGERVVLKQRSAVLVEGGSAPVPELAGTAAPDLVWANLDDHAYGRVRMDAQSLAFARENLSRVQDALTRAGLWLTLWDMARDGQLPVPDYLHAVRTALPHERGAEVANNILQHAATAVLRYLRPDAVEDEAAALQDVLLEALEAEQEDDRRLLLTRHAITFGLGRERAQRLAAWLDGGAPKGVVVDQGMRWRIVTRACAFGMPGAAELLEQERRRDRSDRGVKAAFAARTATPDEALKRQAFDEFATPREFSTDVLKQGMVTFFWPHQAALLAPFARQYLERLPQVIAERDLEYATRGFARLLFPHGVGDAALLQRARETLAGVRGASPVLERILLEEVDELERVVRLRSA